MSQVYVLLEVQENTERRVDSLNLMVQKVNNQNTFLDKLCQRFSLSKRALSKTSFADLARMIQILHPTMNIVEAQITEVVKRYCNG